MGWMGWWGAATVFAVASLAFLGFFRDPDRTPPDLPGAVVAPADGRVMAVVEQVDPWVGQAVRGSLFLSPVDVPVDPRPRRGVARNAELAAAPGGGGRRGAAGAGWGVGRGGGGWGRSGGCWPAASCAG